MTDRELLEAAAKAAGVDVWFPRMSGGKNTDGSQIVLMPCHREVSGETIVWNPLGDDGDALRLAVKLGLVVEIGYASRGFVVVRTNTDNWVEYREAWGDCPDAATRRAIVRAAAGIGGN